MLFIHDPKAMHHIAVKEQDIFEEATWFFRCVFTVWPSRSTHTRVSHTAALAAMTCSLSKRAFGPGLTATHGAPHCTGSPSLSIRLMDPIRVLPGEHHRKQRKLLNPVFSINHMRHMMPTFYTVTHRVNSSLQ